jgi:hypothetical protein
VPDLILNLKKKIDPSMKVILPAEQASSFSTSVQLLQIGFIESVSFSLAKAKS